MKRGGARPQLATPARRAMGSTCFLADGRQVSGSCQVYRPVGPVDGGIIGAVRRTVL